jgi:osmoprotectant transport system permease protein
MTGSNLADQLDHLPEYLGGHMLLTVVALALAVFICLPLGCLVTRVRSLQGPVLTIASVMQTIPGIALLALMVPLIGKIGFLPALIALFIYSTLPILRNTVTGILGVDPTLIEAANGIGMTSAQRLYRVELPLALSVIIAGIRTSAVWVVGTATLSTPVGATSLGNYIFSGLQTQNYTAVLLGCIAAAVLAILLDQIIRLFETAVSRRSRVLAGIGSALLLVVVVGGLSPIIFGRARADGRRTVTLGAKNFTEQYILADLMTDMLQQNGFAAEARTGMGSTILFDALANSSVDAYIDYSGTIWANHMKRTDIPSRQQVLEEMTRWLDKKYDILCLGSLGFENAYAIAVRQQMADSLNLKTIGDLAKYSQNMTMGSDYEFLDRPEWAALKRQYRISFKTLRKLDHSLMYAAIAEGEVDAMPAYTTDGRIIEYDLTLLEDPKQALPPYDAVLLFSPEASLRSDLIQSLKPLVGGIDAETMRRANNMVDSDKRTVSEAAAYLEKTLSGNKGQ